MKKIVFLIAIVMLLKPVLPVVDYVVNYDYISKVLCINKAKPKLECNGKCQLMKELAKTSETETPISSNKKVASHEIEILFFQEIKPFKIDTFCCSNKQHTNINYSDFYSYLNSSSVFRPPIFIS